jgi:hypothetical protein
MIFGSIKPKDMDGNFPHCHILHYKTYKDCPEIELVTLRIKASSGWLRKITAFELYSTVTFQFKKGQCIIVINVIHCVIFTLISYYLGGQIKEKRGL